jgi:hypothetical protein
MVFRDWNFGVADQIMIRIRLSAPAPTPAAARGTYHHSFPLNKKQSNPKTASAGGRLSDMMTGGERGGGMK